MSRRESTGISYKRDTKSLLFPDDSVSLQLEVVICSAYIISIQTFLEIRIKLSHCRTLSDIDGGIYIFVLILFFSH